MEDYRARCLAEFSRGDEARVCNLRAGHDEPHAGYPARSTHGKLLAELRTARGAVDTARADMVRHLRSMAADPSWKPEVRTAFEYAASTFADAGGR